MSSGRGVFFGWGAVATATALVAVPTVFSLFPGLVSWPLTGRLAILAAWLVIAVIGSVLTARHQIRLERLLGHMEQTAENRRVAASNAILEALTRPDYLGVPASYEFTVYVDDGTRLVPVYPHGRGPQDVKVFDHGCGAVGLAAAGATTIVTDDAVWDDTHHLSERQQEFFRDMRVVVAEPARSYAGEVAGVVAAISATNDGYFEGAAGLGTLRNLADSVGVVLVSLWGSGIESSS